MTEQERHQVRKLVDAARRAARLRRELADAERVLSLETQKLERLIKRTVKAQAADAGALTR